MKTIGLIGGMSWESTAVYYRLLNEAVRERLGGLHSASLVLRSVDFAPVAAMQAAGEWERAAEALADAGRGLRAAGASALVICTNTMHKVADQVEAEAGLPLIHIADVTAKALKASGARRPLLLATRFTMEQDFYRGRMAERHGLDVVVPDDAGRADVHRIIYDELCRGVVSDASKARYLAVVEEARGRGIDSIIFGCTEVGLLVAQADFDLPVFDSTALHAAAAVDFSLHS
ncbi:MAG TPA: aspartate/glutamate racemase family protein [Microvirga sp.]